MPGRRGDALGGGAFGARAAACPFVTVRPRPALGLIRWCIRLAPILLVPSCTRAPQAAEARPSAAEQARQVRLMDEIERKIVLPGRARPLKAYARFYAFDGKGGAMARYLIPIPGARGGTTDCARVTPDLQAHLGRCPSSDPWPGIPAGERRWEPDVKSVPFLFDGGCSQVNVAYDPRTGKVEAFCNGFG